MSYAFIYRLLHKWSDKLELRDVHGRPVHLRAHDFRHTYACAMVNNDVDLFSVQSLLDHDSPDMTIRYARLTKETLRRKWEQGQQRINVRGEVVPLDVDGDLSDAAWAKEQIARARQSLPNGWCGLPLQQTCPHPNACLTCPAFLPDNSSPRSATPSASRCASPPHTAQSHSTTPRASGGLRSTASCRPVSPAWPAPRPRAPKRTRSAWP
jgi:hypothetical protein